MLVSVCIPCFNAEQYIAAALDSVLAQTYPCIEIIVVNDGSTDRSREVLTKYEGRIKVLDQSNRGQCAAANRAFSVSSGNLIKFFDADDLLTPEMIAQQVARLGERRDAIALGEWTRFYSISPTNETFARLPMYRDASPVDWLVSEWTHAKVMMQCALWLVPREIISQAGPWNERLSLINDFEYFTRVILAAREILYAPRARLYYRSAVTDSLSTRNSYAAIESQFNSLMLGADHLLRVENTPRTRLACANILQSFDYEHYPKHANLRARIRDRVAELGGADIEPGGPPGFHKLRPWIGWKAARHVQRAAERLGLNSAARQLHIDKTGA